MRVVGADLVLGLVLPARALGRLLRSPRLWPALFVPIVLNCLLVVGLSALILPPAWRWVDGWVGWEGWLGFLVRALVMLVVLVALGFLALQGGSVLGAPWYDALSVKLEIALTGEIPPDETLGVVSALRQVRRSLGFQARKLLLVVVLGPPLLLVALVPLLGPWVSSGGWLVLGSLLIFLEVLDPPLERRRWRFRDKVAAWRRHLPASFGLGAACMFLMGVPLLNLVAVPVCIAAGTIFYCERLRTEGEAEAPEGHPLPTGKDPA